MEKRNKTLNMNCLYTADEKGSWSVHSFNGDYLSIPECTGSYGNLFRKSFGTLIQPKPTLYNISKTKKSELYGLNHPERDIMYFTTQ